LARRLYEKVSDRRKRIQWLYTGLTIWCPVRFGQLDPGFHSSRLISLCGLCKRDFYELSPVSQAENRYQALSNYHSLI
jgi:hypothetical protein